ncbi:MAG: radical SAM protein [Byssovorax sp.]
MEWSVLKKDAAFTKGLLQKKPFSVLIQVTNRCNMECSFCDFWPNAAPRKEELTVADYARVSRELSELGCFLVSIEGGEPLIRPDLLDIIKVFGKDHIPALFTNGWYITAEKARELFAAGLVHASVSIDYPDAARHDKKRGPAGTFDRAWRAVDLLRDAAPRGGKQVHVISVLMEDNWRDIEPLLQQSKDHGVGHQITLLSISGYRRNKQGPDAMPPPEASAALLKLWEKYPHVRFFREYFERMEAFLTEGPMPTCRAGAQGFNLDHVGNISPCIEKIDHAVGNVKTESIAVLHKRLAEQKDEVSRCQGCWTACRGFQQSAGNGGSVRAFLDLGSRMRTS